MLKYPTLSDIPPYLPANRRKLLFFWKSLSHLQQHEDSLLNNRLQAFVVATAFLITAYSQSTAVAVSVTRVAVCVLGFGLALVTAYILRGTAKAIEWYLHMLVEIDAMLFDDCLQPYRTRRRLTGGLDWNDKVARFPRSKIIAHIPYFVCVLWTVLLLNTSIAWWSLCLITGFWAVAVVNAFWNRGRRVWKQLFQACERLKRSLGKENANASSQSHLEPGSSVQSL